MISSTSLNEFDKEEKFDEKLSTFDTISFILISLLFIIEFKFSADSFRFIAKSESCENDSARRSLSPATVSERKIQKGNADSPNGQAAYGLCYVQADGASPNGKDSPIPTPPPRLRFMAHTTGVGRSAVQVKGPTLSSIDANGELA